MESNEARICLRRGHRLDLKTEISTYFCGSRREVRTGMKAGPNPCHVDQEIRKVKELLERKGFRVMVVDL